jgi:glycosyltransferase involved in cell wall biosynthesis
MPLPLPAPFLMPRETARRTDVGAYFVVVGAVEPRNNHLLLLLVWRELAARRGPRTPRLLILGSPARGAGPILEALETSEFLRRHVVLVSGLASPALRALIGAARALLMPSLAEGFGLPIIEALALGTPVLASDLPAHREVGADLAVYLDPADPAAWLREVAAFADGEMAALRRRIAAYRPVTEAQYFQAIAGFLDQLPRRREMPEGAQRRLDRHLTLRDSTGTLR